MRSAGDEAASPRPAGHRFVRLLVRMLAASVPCLWPLPWHRDCTLAFCPFLSASCNLELPQDSWTCVRQRLCASRQPWGKRMQERNAKQRERCVFGPAWYSCQEQPAGSPRRQTHRRAVCCLQAAAPRSSSAPFVPTVRWGSAAAQGQRYAMEDAHIAVPSLEEYAGRMFDEPGAHAFFGVSALACCLPGAAHRKRVATAAAASGVRCRSSCCLLLCPWRRTQR